MLSTLVLFVVSWSVFASAALNVSGVATEACCRRNGKHHCTSGTTDSGNAGAAFTATSPGCPHHSHSSLLTGAARLQSNTSFRLHLPTANLLTVADVLFQDSRSEIRHVERGPPSAS
ncbi:MAG TPA: hypothetical protein VFA74_06660 [Terriglobales bacterium]|nr:hypothetical protein [Terriglobales bacterium]